MSKFIPNLILVLFVFTILLNAITAINSGDITLTGPADNLWNKSTNTTQPFVFKFVNNNNATALCELNIDNAYVYSASVVNNTATSFFSNTTLTEAAHTWNITCTNTTATTTTLRTLQIDRTAPSFGTITVTNVTGGVNTTARFNFTVTDARQYIDLVGFIWSNGTETSIPSTRETSNATVGSSINYQFDIQPSDVPYDGKFTFGWTGYETNTSLQNGTATNQTNWTKTSLNEGWNLISVDTNTTMSNFTLYSSYISKVSKQNFSATSYTLINYVSGLSTNRDTALSEGDAIWVYSDQDTAILRQYTSSTYNVNNSLVYGWNLLSAFNATITTAQLCNEAIDNTSAGIKSIAIYDNPTATWYGHRCGFTYYNSLNILRGQGYYVNVNTTTTQVRYREL